MPFKIPFLNLVVTGHRGEILRDRQDNAAVRALSGQPKDGENAYLEARPNLHHLRVQHRPRGALPSITVRRMSEYTRFPDDKAVARAAARKTVEADNPDAVVHAVTGHIRTELLKTPRGQAPLILVGEAHGTVSSLLINLAALAQFQGQRTTLLFEYTPQEVGMLEDDARFLDQSFANDLQGLGDWLPLESIDPRDPNERARRETAHHVFIALVAAKAGARLGAFDPLHSTARNEVRREAAMVEAIRDHVAAANGPVIVIAGAHHLPKLHEQLGGGSPGVVSLSVVVDTNTHPPTANKRKRSSYLFARDDILRVRYEPPQDALPCDPVGYALGLVGDLSKPLPAEPLRVDIPKQRSP